MGAFNSYHIWLGIPFEEQPANHYRLLGIQLFEDNPTVIANSADQRMAHLRTLQSGSNANEAARLLNEVAAAQILLLDPQRKGKYDAMLRSAHSVAPPVAQRLTTPVIPAANVPSIAPPPVVALQRQPTAGQEFEFLKAPTPYPRRSSSSGQDGRKQNSRPWLIAVGACTFFLFLAWYFAPLREHVKHVAPSPSSAQRKSSKNGNGNENKGTDATRLSAPERAREPMRPVISHLPTVAKQPSGTVRSPEAKQSTDEKVARLSSPAASAPERGQIRLRDNERADPPVPEFTADEAKAIEEQPKEDLVAQASELLRTQFESAITPAQKADAARAFQTAASRAFRDPKQQYTLLKIARDLALSSGHAPVTFEIIDAMDDSFKVDSLAMKETAFRYWAEQLPNAFKGRELKDKQNEMARWIADLAGAALVDKEYGPASQLYLLASEEYRVAGEPTKSKNMRELATAPREIKQLTVDGEAALNLLESHPDDVKANVVAGKYLCLIQDEWKRGIAKLANGDDVRLRAVAIKEQNGALTEEQHAKLGDLWWTIAESASNFEKPRYRSRSVMFYKQASGFLKGKYKDRVEARLKLAQDETAVPWFTAGPDTNSEWRFDRLTRELNRPHAWVEKSGNWRIEGGWFVGSGVAEAIFNSALPTDFRLEFRMRVTEGTRPRVELLFGETVLTVLDSGNRDRKLTMAGELPGYRWFHGSTMNVGIVSNNGRYHLYVNSSLVGETQRNFGQREPRLRLRSGDETGNPGTCGWADFALRPIDITNSGMARRVEDQHQVDNSPVGRYRRTLYGARPEKTTIVELRPDDTALENGEETGTWSAVNGQVFIRFHNIEYGIARLRWANNNLLIGQNTFRNGAVYDWQMTRITNASSDGFLEDEEPSGGGLFPVRQ